MSHRKISCEINLVFLEYSLGPLISNFRTVRKDAIKMALLSALSANQMWL